MKKVLYKHCVKKVKYAILMAVGRYLLTFVS